MLGRDVLHIAPDERTRFRGESIGFVFQAFNLLPALTALENVSVPLLLNGVSRQHAEDRARAVLQSVGLGERSGATPTKLSGGQQQRVAIARRIHDRTGWRARSAADLKADTVRWFLVNSEDVGDIAAMLTLAMTVGFGVTGVMLYMFTLESQRQYATLKALGATSRTVLAMVFVQAAVCALIGAGIGLGLCGIAGVLVVSLAAAVLSALPILKLPPGVVFAGR